jgi:phosphohistidine phosphatase
MIWLLRHGDAEEAAEDDAARRLTESGERQAEAAGRALEALEAGVGACLTSPKVRARDMARIACRGLGVEVKAGSFTHLRAHETVLDLVCRLGVV